MRRSPRPAPEVSARTLGDTATPTGRATALALGATLSLVSSTLACSPAQKLAPEASAEAPAEAFAPASAPAPAEASAEASAEARGRMGSHGMVIIGDTELLLHHLALYQAPHDRQVLIPAAFTSDADRAAFEAWRARYEGLATVVPEPFDLDRLAPGAADPLTRVVVDIYEGHFERGGTLKFASVDVRVSTPVLHRPVEDTAADAPRFTYLAHGSRAYLVRDIGPRPGEDHVLEVRPAPGLTSGERLKARSPALDAERLRFERADRSSVELRSMGTVYLETSDFR